MTLETRLAGSVLKMKFKLGGEKTKQEKEKETDYWSDFPKTEGRRHSLPDSV